MVDKRAEFVRQLRLSTAYAMVAADSADRVGVMCRLLIEPMREFSRVMRDLDQEQADE